MYNVNVYLSLSLVFVPTLIHECNTVGFISNPQNVSVKIGGTASFECIFDGPDVILWIINGISYAYGSQFPPKHMTDDSGNILTVTNVDQWLNRNSYQCITTHFESLVAYLLICTDSQHVNSEYSSPSTHFVRPTTITTSIKMTESDFINTQLRVTITGVKSSATAIPTVTYHFNHDSEVIIIGTIVSTVFAIICCCGLGIIIIVGFKVVHRPNKRKNHQREPGLLFKNDAYEVTKIRKQAKIITKPNDAYSVVKLS